MTFKNTAFVLALASPLASPLWAQAMKVHEPQLQVPTLQAVGPQDTADSVQAPRLRDAFRQPPGGAAAQDKPFRLSAEERRRLREQLRSLSEQGGISQ